MRINISYEKMVFRGLSEVELQDVLKFASKLDVYEAPNGYAVKGKKCELYDLIVNLSYKYDVEIV